MSENSIKQCVMLCVFCGVLCGCGEKKVTVPPDWARGRQEPAMIQKPAPQTPVFDGEKASVRSQGMEASRDVTIRVVTEDELTAVHLEDSELTPAVCKQILARLNIRAPYHIAEDIRRGKPLRAPRCFAAYRSWTPLPHTLPDAAALSKLILVVKDIPFVGWYEKGRLVGDTEACIGQEGQSTQAGVFSILEKDADHHSRSYSNSFGQPAWMPWSMRLYEAVWIHAGDITGPHCSHGCVTLPLKAAEELYNWTGPETTVVVVDSLNDIRRFLSGGRPGPPGRS